MEFDEENVSLKDKWIKATLRLPGLLFLELIITNTLSAELFLGNEEGWTEWLKHHLFDLFLYAIGCSLILLPVDTLKIYYAHMFGSLAIVFGHCLNYGYALKYNFIKTSRFTSFVDVETFSINTYNAIFTESKTLTEEIVTIILFQITLGLLVVYITQCKLNLPYLPFTPMMFWVVSAVINKDLLSTYFVIKLSQTITLCGLVFFFIDNSEVLTRAVNIHFTLLNRHIAAWPGLFTVIWIKYEFSKMFMSYWILRFCIHFYDNLTREHFWSNFFDNHDINVPFLLKNETLNYAWLDKVFVVFVSAAQCTSSAFTLVGLSCIVSKIINLLFFILRSWLCWSFSQHPPDTVHVGAASLVDGITMMTMSIYIGLADLEIPSRVIFLAYILLTVFSSQLPAIHTVIDDTMMAAVASPIVSKYKHMRLFISFLLLLFTCGFISFIIFLILAIDEISSFWLIIISHNYFVTFWLTVGSIAIYALMIMDQKLNFESINVEDISFYIRGFSRSIEYVINLVLCLYLMNVFYSEISSLPVVILLGLYVYYCIAWKGKKAWNVLKLRRLAATKVASLKNPTQEDISIKDDVCPICYQDLSDATNCKEMHCRHTFHFNCLKKWFYVRDQCPVCHTDFNKKVEVEKTKQNINRKKEPKPSSDNLGYSTASDESDTEYTTTDNEATTENVQK